MTSESSPKPPYTASGARGPRAAPVQDGRFASLNVDAASMDVLDEPVVATTQLLFNPPAAVAPAGKTPPLRTTDPRWPPAALADQGLPADPRALLEELLARLKHHRRRR